MPDAGWAIHHLRQAIRRCEDAAIRAEAAAASVGHEGLRDSLRLSAASLRSEGAELRTSLQHLVREHEEMES